MLIRRLLICVLAGFCATGTLRAQSANLTEAPLVDRSVRNEISMVLAGKITAKQDGKTVVFPHKATARHVFMERYLDANGPIAAKAARFYTTAESAIVFDNNDSSKRHASARAALPGRPARQGADRLVQSARPAHSRRAGPDRALRHPRRRRPPPWQNCRRSQNLGHPQRRRSHPVRARRRHRAQPRRQARIDQGQPRPYRRYRQGQWHQPRRHRSR